MVPCELFIRALAVQHYFEAGPARLGEHAPLRENAGAAIRLILMPSDTLCFCKGVFEPGMAPMRYGRGPVDNGLHERPLVDRFYIIAGAYRVHPRAVSSLVEIARHQAHD